MCLIGEGGGSCVAVFNVVLISRMVFVLLHNILNIDQSVWTTTMMITSTDYQ